MGTLDKIFKGIEQISQTKGTGFGVDVTDLVGKDLVDSANVGAGLDIEKQKPVIGAVVKKGQTEYGIAGSSSTDLGLGARYTSEDESTTASLNAFKSPQEKGVMFRYQKKFKSGGEVEVGKGKDYIKDLI